MCCPLLTTHLSGSPIVQDGRLGIVNGRAMRAPTSHNLNAVGATIGRPPKLSRICSHRRAIWRRKRTRHARPYKPYPQPRRGDHRSSAKKGNIIPKGLILPFLLFYNCFSISSRTHSCVFFEKRIKMIFIFEIHFFAYLAQGQRGVRKHFLNLAAFHFTDVLHNRKSAFGLKNPF